MLPSCVVAKLRIWSYYHSALPLDCRVSADSFYRRSGEISISLWRGGRSMPEARTSSRRRWRGNSVVAPPAGFWHPHWTRVSGVLEHPSAGGEGVLRVLGQGAFCIFVFLYFCIFAFLYFSNAASGWQFSRLQCVSLLRETSQGLDAENSPLWYLQLKQNFAWFVHLCINLKS